MKVLYILSYTTTSAGATRSFLQLLKQMLNYDIEVWVVIPSKTDVYYVLKKMPVHIIILPVRSSAYPDMRNWIYNLAFIPRLLYWKTLNIYSCIKLKKILKSENIDIVHSNVSILDVGIKAANAVRIHHVFHFREYGDKDFGIHYFPCKKVFYRKLQSPLSHIICITRDIQTHHKLDNYENSVVIYNGIASKHALKIKAHKERYFLYAGRIEKAKGLLDLVEAYNKYCSISNDPIPLKIAGKINDKNYYNQIVKYIDTNHLRQHIEFMGEQKDISPLLLSATALIVPSLFEGFGRCMAEAMFNDCLVIGKNTGGTKEQFENGKTITGQNIGLKYNINTELAQILNIVEQTPSNHFDGYRERARQTVCELYTTEKCAENVYNLYKSLILEKSI